MSTRATEAESVLKEHMGYLPVSEMERRGVPARRFRDSCVKPSLRKRQRAYMFICFTECGVRSAVRIAVSISESHFFA